MASNGDIMRLCRLCLVKDEVNIPIFDDHSSVQQIFMKISSCLPVTISKDDKLPKKICDGCSGKLDMLYQFWNTSAKAEKQLLLWLNQAGINFEKTKMDTNSSASEQSINKAVDSSIVKQENEDYVEGKVETSEISTEAKSYILQQQQLPYQKEFSFPEKDPVESGASVKSSETEEPPPKRARRAAAMKAPIQAIDSDDEDDEVDDIEPITKTEDESEDSGREEDNDPSFEPASVSADDQPGPSGVGKGSADASLSENDDEAVNSHPSGKDYSGYKLKSCKIVVEQLDDVEVPIPLKKKPGRKPAKKNVGRKPVKKNTGRKSVGKNIEPELLEEDEDLLPPEKNVNLKSPKKPTADKGKKPAGRRSRYSTCYKCLEKFQTPEELEEHTAIHDESEEEVEDDRDLDVEIGELEEVVDEFDEEPEDVSPKTSPKSGTPQNISKPVYKNMKSNNSTNNETEFPSINNIALKCDICDVTLRSTDALINHKPKDDKECSFTCKVCSKKYANPAPYLGHIMKHNLFNGK